MPDYQEQVDWFEELGTPTRITSYYERGHIRCNPLIISLASGWGKISFNFRGILSSKTTSAYHLEPKATNCIKIGSVSLPFPVSLHSTLIGDLFSSAHSMNPSFSSCLRRIERTLGVRPGIDSRSRLKRTILRNPISLIIRIVHFLPNTPRLVLIGHSMNLTWGRITPSSLLTDSSS